MANKVIISHLNPLQFFLPDLASTRDEKYNSKDFTDFELSETILPWEQNVGYCQPFQLNDSIPLQIQSNIGPVNFVLRDCETGDVINTVQLDQKQESVTEPGLFIYELSFPLAGYEPGCYYGELQFGDDVFLLRTGELNFEELHENSLLLQYKHFENREDIIFETGWLGAVRVQGIKKYLGPKQKTTVYEDQVLDSTNLRAQKYRLWELKVGGTPARGIPDYFADMIGGIIGCSDFRIDGKNYTVPEGKEMEPVEVEKYPLRGWAVEIRERYTKASVTFENDVPVGGRLTAMINSDSKGFGNSVSGSQTAVIDVN